MNRMGLALLGVVLVCSHGFAQTTSEESDTLRGTVLALNSAFQAPKVQKAVPHSMDPMKRALVEPVMALHYAEEIGLTAGQRAEIEEQLDQARIKFKTLDEKLGIETKTMFELLRGPAVSERDALEQLDRILELEKQIKQVNLLCSIRVRASLKPAQRERLMQLPVPPPPPPPPPVHVP